MSNRQFRSALCLLLLAVSAAFALTLVPAPLQDLSAGAERIAIVRAGKTRSVAVPLPGGGTMPARETALEVVESLKGNWRSKETVQWRHRAPSKTPGIDGAIELEEGATYLLFLGKDSPATGLAAPAGEGQGVFRQTVREDGTALIENECGNLGLFDGIDAGRIEWKDGRAVANPELEEKALRLAASKPGPVEREALVELVRALLELSPSS